MWSRICLSFCLTTAISLTLHAGPTHAECVDYSVFPTVTAVEREWTGNGRVQLFGDDYLLALADNNLRVFSLADPSSPSYLAQVDCEAGLTDLAICAEAVYCRDQSGAVHVVTLADPAYPVLLGTADLGGEVTSVGGKDDLLAVTAPDSTWRLYRIDDPIAPRLLHQDRCDFTLSGVIINDGVMVVYGGGWRAYDVDLTSHNEPTPINEQWYGSFHDYFCVGSGTDVLACAVRGQDLIVYLNQWESYEFWYEYYFFGCAGRNNLSLAVIDLASGSPDPTVSVSLGSNLWGAFAGDGLSDIGTASLVLCDHYVYALQGDSRIFPNERNRIGIFDLDDKLAPVAVIPSGCFHSFAVRGNQVYATGPLPLTTFEVPSPPVDNIVSVGWQYYDPYYNVYHATAGDGWAAFLGSRHIAWFENIWRLHIFSLDHHEAHYVQVNTFDRVDAIAAAGDRLLCCSQLDEFMLWIDLADPEHPSGPQVIPIPYVSHIAPGPSRLAAMICGPTDERSLKIYDLTQPMNPVLLGSADPGICDPATTVGLLWQGDLVFAIAPDGLRVIDVRDTTAPVLASVVALDSLEWLRPAAGLRVLAGNDHDVHLIDATDPAAPQIVASMSSPFEISDVRSVKDVVYLANVAGVWALDLPRLEYFGALAPTTDVSFLVDQADALWGEAPKAVGPFELPIHCGGPSAVAEPTGVPASVARVVISPNPFKPGATIHFTAPAGGTMELLIFDLSGRVVRTLIDGQAAQGPQQVVWDGRGEDGRTVASGTYLVRLRTGKGTETEKLVFLK